MVPMSNMPKKKTSLNIEEGTWKEWVIWVTTKYGSGRMVSEETERALKEYMERHDKKVKE